MTTTIWWIRRDLRLSDNQALMAALAEGGPVIPVFILDPVLLRSAYVGPKRLAFLLEGLRRLEADLQRRGSRLLVRRGRLEEELAHLLAESGAGAVFAEADYSIQRQIGCLIGQDYPAPIVDHRRAREQVLALYRQPRQGQR